MILEKEEHYSLNLKIQKQHFSILLLQVFLHTVINKDAEQKRELN